MSKFYSEWVRFENLDERNDAEKYLNLWCKFKIETFSKVLNKQLVEKKIEGILGPNFYSLALKVEVEDDS